MSINFILEIILMISLGTIIYLVARAVPRISDIASEERDLRRGVGEKLNKVIDSLPIEKVDLAISRFLERLLRNIKLLVMRVDNKLGHHLAKFKAKISNGEQNEKKPTLFDELNGKKSETEKPEERDF